MWRLRFSGSATAREPRQSLHSKRIYTGHPLESAASLVLVYRLVRLLMAIVGVVPVLRVIPDGAEDRGPGPVKVDRQFPEAKWSVVRGFVGLLDFVAKTPNPVGQIMPQRLIVWPDTEEIRRCGGADHRLHRSDGIDSAAGGRSAQRANDRRAILIVQMSDVVPARDRQQPRGSERAKEANQGRVVNAAYLGNRADECWTARHNRKKDLEGDGCNINFDILA